ncbi:MAG: hypothetical protein K2Q25_02445, partial [Mycobacteriaceae bacterium]|nr:hypothetical protein [Mycobacteriaceae bacterium]
RESTNPSHQGGLLPDLAATPMAAATPAIRQTSTNTSPASTPGVWRPTQVNQDGGSHRKPIPAAAQQHRPAESEDETASLATVFGANGHTPIDIETPDNEPLPWAQRRTDRRVVATSDPDPQPKG